MKPKEKISNLNFASRVEEPSLNCINHLYNKKSKNLQFILLFISFIIASCCIINGCDPCGIGGQTVYPDFRSDIYFSAIPVNDSVPNVYGISADGSNYRLIAPQGELYSAPSENNLLLYLRRHETIRNQLFLINLKNGQTKEIVPDPKLSDYLRIDQPLLSPDGNSIIFTNSGFMELYYIRTNDTFSCNLTRICAENSMPVYSPDSKMMAYYEGASLEQALTIKIINLSNPTKFYTALPYLFGLANHNALATIDWAKDGSDNLAFVLTKGKDDVLYYVKYYDPNQFIEINTDSIGAYNPVVSPDGTTLAFAANNGNIYLKKVDDKSHNFQKLTDCNEGELNLYPQWSPDGKKILYTKYFLEDFEKYKGRLEVINISTGKIKVLCNNAFMGFWSK